MNPLCPASQRYRCFLFLSDFSIPDFFRYANFCVFFVPDGFVCRQHAFVRQPHRICKKREAVCPASSFVNLSAMNYQASRRTSKQLHRLASANTPKMNKTNIPESIRFSQPGYRHAVSGRWRFLWTDYAMLLPGNLGSHSSA